MPQVQLLGISKTCFKTLENGVLLLWLNKQASQYIWLIWQFSCPQSRIEIFFGFALRQQPGKHGFDWISYNMRLSERNKPGQPIIG